MKRRTPAARLYVPLTAGLQPEKTAPFWHKDRAQEVMQRRLASYAALAVERSKARKRKAAARKRAS